jgi:hypothetical protein
MASKAPKHPSSELFRFARLSPTRVVDIEHRIRARGLPHDAEKRAAWSKAFLRGGTAVSSLADLTFPYVDHLKPGVDVSARIPGQDDLRDPAAFEKALVAADQRYAADLTRARDTLLALALDEKPDTDRLELVSRLVQFLETFPKTAEAASEVAFAPLVLKRVGRIATARTKDTGDPGAKSRAEQAADLRKLAAAVRTVWQARNDHIRALNTAHVAARRGRADVIAAAKPAAPLMPPQKGSATSRLRAAEVAAKKMRDIASTAREAANRAINDTRNAFEYGRAETTLAGLLDNGMGGLTKELPASKLRDVREALATIKDKSGKYGIPVKRYCEAYGAIVSQMDDSGAATAEPGSTIDGDGSFESPQVTFVDAVRVLGKADLVRVDEEFVRYAAGEISYIQTVLANEKRKRHVRSSNTMESSSEQLQDEVVDRSQETSASTKAELKSEVETELKTRLDSSVNASGNASGGGTIGVVDVSGAASVGASVGVGLDTGMQTKNESNFAQEIVQKGIERTTRRTMQRRLSRTVQTYDAFDSHEIDNVGGEMMNGTYVFLNKRVAIKETTYGARAFLEAKVLAPGRTLVAARISRVHTAEDAIGTKPVFTITPASITPANYMQLTGQYRAQNVEPPPSPVTTLSRVYKTDTSTASSEPEQFNGKKIADILVPFFGQYKRYLITDNVELPEGYEVAEVDIAVSHGANGVSIPAHLAFTLPTTAVYAGASFTPFAIGLLGIAFLPAWVWSVGFMASPLLHYNADSSNVSITVGTEGQDSAYFFFEPDELLNEIIALLQSLLGIAPDFVSQVQALANAAITDMLAAAQTVPPEIALKVSHGLSDAIDNVKAVLDELVHGHLKGARDALGNLAAPTVNMDDLASIPTIFAPLRTFITGLGSLVVGDAAQAISQTFAMLLTRLNNNQTLPFFACEGARVKVPIAINAMALKPGITITASICLRRTDDALARWQLRTFDAFYQAHLQLVAAYENRAYQSDASALAAAPDFLRREEQAAVKERVLHAINGIHDTTPLTYDIDKLALFEHALDWENMTYRLFNYGPSSDELRYERLGVLLGSDDRRRQFLTATWAEVMIPVQPHQGLEEQILAYFGDGSGSLDAAIAPGEHHMDELAALYRDLVLSRAIGEAQSGTITYAWVPTDLVALYRPTLASELPRNPDYPPDA